MITMEGEYLRQRTKWTLASAFTMWFLWGVPISKESLHIANEVLSGKILINLLQLICSTMCLDQKGFIQEFERTEQQKTHTICTQCTKLLTSLLLNTPIRNVGRQTWCEFLKGPVWAEVPGNPGTAGCQFGQSARIVTTKKMKSARI